MTDEDFLQIEAALSIKIPVSFRRLIQSDLPRLRQVAWFVGESPVIFLEPEIITSTNLIEREPNSSISYEFPDWWSHYFIFGSNWGGNYYALKLDNTPGVWDVGFETGKNPELLSPTLEEFIEKELADWEVERLRREQVENRRAPYREEIAAQLEAIEAAGNPTNAKKWQLCMANVPMASLLDGLWEQPSNRKWFLLGVACCRQAPEFQTDDECQTALTLAEEFIEGIDNREAILGMAKRLNERPRKEVDALRRLYFSERYSFHDLPTSLEEDVTYDLMREVLGNPFLAVEFPDAWKSPDVIQLAQSIYDEKQFDRMPELGRLLESAGCSDARVLSHCRRIVGHVRGGWVLDELLQKEPRPLPQVVHWDYSWKHPTIPEEEIKAQLAKFGTGVLSPEDFRKASLTFADWVSAQGDAVWSNCIRVLSLSEASETSEEEVTRIEDHAEASALLTFVMLFKIKAKFGDFDRGDFRFGLPSEVRAVHTGKGARPIQMMTQQWDQLVQKTPVRGLNIEQNYLEEMEHFFGSPGARHLRTLRFWIRNDGKSVSPVISALVSSDAAKTLEVLDISASLSDGDAAALASARFARLHTLAVGPSRLDPDHSASFVQAAWFRDLKSLKIDLEKSQDGNILRNLSQMPRLKSLTVHDPTVDQTLALDESCEYPTLRRLSFLRPKLAGASMRSFVKSKMPHLQELALGQCDSSADDLHELFQSALCENLKILELYLPNVKTLEILANGCFSKSLRILNVGFLGEDTTSLKDSPLTDPTAFPNLTTLKISFAEDIHSNTGDFLGKLATPKLRHLALSNCRFDDASAKAIERMPTFSRLRRLSIENDFGTPEQLSPQAFSNMLLSPNLQNLVELNVWHFRIGDALGVLLDPTVLPNLSAGYCIGAEVPHDIIRKLKTLRPTLAVDGLPLEQ